MTTQELLAHALAAFDAEGHNDAPLYDDLSPDEQERLMETAGFVLKVLVEQGYQIIPPALAAGK